MRIKTAIIGLGSVNRNLLRIIADKRDRLCHDYNVEFQIVCIADSSGVAIDPIGFDPTAVSRFIARRFHPRSLLLQARCTWVF